MLSVVNMVVHDLLFAVHIVVHNIIYAVVSLYMYTVRSVICNYCVTVRCDDPNIRVFFRFYLTNIRCGKWRHVCIVTYQTWIYKKYAVIMKIIIRLTCPVQKVTISNSKVVDLL